MIDLDEDIFDIDHKIYVIRGQRVMLDIDLAEIYGVATKRLREQIKRNITRFPEDFMFALNYEEVAHLGFRNFKHGGHRVNPYAFTENGVAMLSSVLNSERAIQINISIIRTFTKLRSFLALESSLNERMGKLEVNTNKIFKIVFEKMDSIEEQLKPALPERRKKIGLKK